MTATKRSATRRDRAARLLPVIALDQRHADKLTSLCEATGETATAAVRRLIMAAKLPRGEGK